jgi:phosphatidylethanolamine/phosphatidyl-N-methylethanolamine N-methyltransferase
VLLERGVSPSFLTSVTMKKLSSQHVVRTYRYYAPIYDFLFGKILEHGRQQLCRLVHTTFPETILEIGVGTGLTLFNYPNSVKVVGIDLSIEMLDRARVKAENLIGRNINLYVMNAEKLNFADNSFDCVTVPYVLSVTPNPQKLISELRRVCKPTGDIFILNHFSGSRFWWVLERMVSSVADKIGFRSDFHFHEHILAHDWRIVSVHSVNFMGLSKLVHIQNE